MNASSITSSSNSRCRLAMRGSVKPLCASSPSRWNAENAMVLEPSRNCCHSNESHLFPPSLLPPYTSYLNQATARLLLRPFRSLRSLRSSIGRPPTRRPHGYMSSLHTRSSDQGNGTIAIVVVFAILFVLVVGFGCAQCRRRTTSDRDMPAQNVSMLSNFYSSFHPRVTFLRLTNIITT